MAPRGARLNVLYMDCHDLGDWLPAYGRPYLRAPHLTRLGEEGAVFTRYFATAPICTPSRATMFTGNMPHTCGVTAQNALGLDQVCLAERFRRAGYRTVLAGRLQIKNDPAWVGFERVLPAERGDSAAAEAAARFLLEEAGGSAPDLPFVLSLSFHLVHRPIGLEHDPQLADEVAVPPALPDEPDVRRDLAVFCRAIEALDAHVGVVLEALRRAGLEDDTIVVFTTDHGAPFPRAKHTLYDPGIKTALVLHYPPAIRAGTRPAQLLSNTGLMPTLLELAGCAVPTDVLGRSFAGVLETVQGSAFNVQGSTGGLDAVFAEHTWGTRGGRWQYIPGRCVRTARHKYIRSYTPQPPFADNGWLQRFPARRAWLEDLFGRPQPEEALYDLEADPHEFTNLAADPAHAAVRAALAARMDRFLAETDDPILRGPVPHPEGKPEAPQFLPDGHGRYRLAPTDPADTGERPFSAVPAPPLSASGA